MFYVIGCNAANKIMKKKAVKRKQLLSYLANIPSCIVVMEACATSNYWGREIGALGHKVSLIPPQHVKAFLRAIKMITTMPLPFESLRSKPISGL